jgi:tRNA threonylcarbamoyladenosine biosynthesis protein TsaB
MLLLSIDSSGKQGSIALARAGDQSAANDGVEVIEVVQLAGGTFSAQLVPQIAKLLADQGFTKHDIGAFVVVSGPGSFTGIRVGLAATKALSEVLRKPITAVSLLEVYGFASGAPGQVLVALDAGRGDVYVGEYEVSRAAQRAAGERILSRTEFFAEADGSTVVTPDAVVVAAAAAAGVAVTVLPPVSAGVVARLGWRKMKSGAIVTAEQLEANYIRRIDAEIVGKK